MILRDMVEDDLETVVGIEQQVHADPWTRGNFADALRSGYLCKIAEVADELLGYAVMMLGPDEAELLDIAIAADRQHQGWGYKLLGEMLMRARRHGLRRAVLEVRVSNTPAIALYRRQGFAEMGLRRDYYVAENGREDAMLMGCML